MPKSTHERPAAQRATTVATASLLLMLLTAPACFGQALILTEPFAFRTAIQEAAVALEAMLLERGLVSEVRPANGAPLGDLSTFQCVWDLRIDDSLSPDEMLDLITFAQGGGGMLFTGEHASFDARNSSVLGLIIALGGGGPLTDSVPAFPSFPVDYPEVVNLGHPIGTDCAQATEVVYDGVDNGHFIDVGFGIVLTQEATGANRGAAYFDEGTMFGALTARAAVVLDINWLATAPGTGTLDFRIDGVTPTQNRQFAQNLITELCGLCCGATTPLAALPPLASRAALAALPPTSPASPADPCPVASTPTSKSGYQTYRKAERFFAPRVAGRSRNASLRVPPTTSPSPSRTRNPEQGPVVQP